MPRTLTISLAVLVIALFISAPAMAFSEDVTTALNIGSTLSSIGTTHFNVGAVPGYAPIFHLENRWAFGSSFEYQIGTPGELYLILSDPQDRAQIVRVDVTELQSMHTENYEIDIDHQNDIDTIMVVDNVVIADLEGLIRDEGAYALQFSIISKLRGRQSFIFSWNVGVDTPTGSSTVLIFASNPQQQAETPTEERMPVNESLSLQIGGQDFGSADAFYVSGVDELLVRSPISTEWEVFENGSRVNFQNESFLVLRPQAAGTFQFRADGDEMTIVVLSPYSPGKSEAEADSDVTADICSNGTISVQTRLHAYAYAEPGQTPFVIAVASPERVPIEQYPTGYYPTGVQIFRTDVPQSTWFWSEENGWVDTTCGPPPSNWGWQPPVPPPPSSGWAPEVPPVP